MTLRTHRPLLLTTILALALATGCDSRRSGGDDDDDDAGGRGLAGLDRDNDGELTDEDVSSGEGAVYWVSVQDGDEEGATEEGHTDSSASLVSGDGGWGVEIKTTGDLALAITIWFANPDPQTSELSVGTGELQNVSASTQAEDFLVWADSSVGDVTITDVSDGVSGYFEGEIVIKVADRFEELTGQVIRIEGFAFNGLQLPMDM
jgi:hypothetical protein